MAELDREIATPPGSEPSPSARPALRCLDQVGREVAGRLSSALERVEVLTATGRIDRAGLRSLRDEIAGARAAAMLAQKIAHYAGGRVRQAHERIALATVLRDALHQLGDEAKARGIALRQLFKAVDVHADPTLLHALVHALLAWAVEQARDAVEWRLDQKAWPPVARLTCRVAASVQLDAPTDAEPVQRPDGNLPWLLAEHVAAIMGVPLSLERRGPDWEVTVEFPHTVRETIDGVSAIEIDDGFAPSSLNSRPLVGSHVLVIAARRDVRSDVREALRPMGLIIDFASTVDEAREFCRGGLPHGFVYEAALDGQRLASLRDEVLRANPSFGFVELDEEGSAFEVSGFSGRAVSRVGREALASGLPSALAYELTKGG